VSPVFSPSGKRIAFASNTDGNYEIYVMNADGTGLLRLTRAAAEDTSPHWSPDETKIGFSSNREGKSAVYELIVPR
jgi:Tol biopolymer transport system component